MIGSILSIIPIVIIHISLIQTVVNYAINYTIYTGRFFNFSTPHMAYNKTMDWLQASNSFTYGFALPNMAGNKILLTGRRGTLYHISVVSPRLSSYTLANNKCNELIESKIMAIIKVTKGNVSALNVTGRVGLLSRIALVAGLPGIQHVMLTTAEGIRFSKQLAFPQNLPRDSYFLFWIKCSRYEYVNKIKSEMRTIAQNLHQIVGNVDWFLVLNYNTSFVHIKKQRHRRFADSENNNIINKTLQILKINDMQTMNFIIPNTIFPIYSHPNGVEVYQIINGSRSLLKENGNTWIRFTQSTRTIRFQPKIKDHGVHILQICSNETSRNESCYILQINVAPLKPQVHQIHIREERNEHIINYTLPLVWFRAQKVIKDSQIQVSSVKASIPIVWGNFNTLLLLNLSSIEGTVLELMVNVVVNNETFVQLELMMPLMSLSKTKMIIYQFRSTIKWLKFPFTIPKILLFELRNLLENMTQKIQQLIQNEVGPRRVTILPLHIYGDTFDSIYIEKEILIFDWTFSIDSSLPESCIIDSDSVIRSFSKLSTKIYLFLNNSIVKSKSNSGCGLTNNPKRTTSVSTVTRSWRRMNLHSTRTPIVQTDSQWKSVSIPNQRLSVECGKIFQYSLPPAVSDNQNLKILPVLFTGPEPDWITFSSNNKLIWGVIAKTLCPKKEFQFKITGTNFKKRILIESTLILDVVTNVYQKDHKFQIELVLINLVSFSVSQLIKTITHVKQYIESTCRKDIDCNFNLTLIRSSVKGDGSVHITLGYHENSTSCPQTLGIFLRNQFIDKSFISSPQSPNSALVQIFYHYGLGQLIQSNLLLNQVCQNKNIFPPDLGQKIVFTNIPSVVSLKPFLEFYNQSVEFFIGDHSKNQLIQENYSQWMKMSNNSQTLFILALNEHVRNQPYIVELSVYPDTKHKILLPKIAVEVRNLLDHPDFNSFMRELNHQIFVVISTTLDLVDSNVPFALMSELCEVVDRYLRPDCSDASKNDCGTDILIFFNSRTKTLDGHNISFKFSSLRILKEGSQFDQNEVSYQKRKCPLKSLNEMQSRLKITLQEYGSNAKLNRTWAMESFNVLYMGSCVHTETAFIKLRAIEDASTSPVQIWKEKKLNFDRTQQMFLMATVIPAGSFIFITLLLGIVTACLLSRRNRKKYMCNSATLKIPNYPPVIYQSDTEIYSPPSKPLILQHEKPPQPLPDDDEEDGEALIPNMQSMTFYRPAI